MVALYSSPNIERAVLPSSALWAGKSRSAVAGAKRGVLAIVAALALAPAAMRRGGLGEPPVAVTLVAAAAIVLAVQAAPFQAVLGTEPLRAVIWLLCAAGALAIAAAVRVTGAVTRTGP